MSGFRLRGLSSFAGLRRQAALLLTVALATVSCSALNPAAVDVLFPPNTAMQVEEATIENPPGHVVIVFINNTTFDAELLEYLRSQNLNVDGIPNLRPRVRLRMRASYTQDATEAETHLFEFVDGSEILEGAITVLNEDGEQVTIPPVPPADLTENDLTNFVVVCPVYAVVSDGLITTESSPLEVFVPVFRKEIRIVEEEFTTRRELNQTFDPRFANVYADSVNEDGVVTERRNIGTREIPGFPTELTCGSVVVIEVTGELSVSFVRDEQNELVPGFLTTDDAARLSDPGRFQVNVSVR